MILDVIINKKKTTEKVANALNAAKDEVSLVFRDEAFSDETIDFENRYQR